MITVADLPAFTPFADSPTEQDGQRPVESGSQMRVRIGDHTIDRAFPYADINKVDARVRGAMAAQGFGVLNEIDVAAAMKNVSQDMAPAASWGPVT